MVNSFGAAKANVNSGFYKITLSDHPEDGSIWIRPGDAPNIIFETQLRPSAIIIGRVFPVIHVDSKEEALAAPKVDNTSIKEVVDWLEGGNSVLVETLEPFIGMAYLWGDDIEDIEVVPTWDHRDLN